MSSLMVAAGGFDDGLETAGLEVVEGTSLQGMNDNDEQCDGAGA
jgi:hypothetical protein